MTVDFSPEELYGVVADVSRYKEFLPWCVESDVLYEDPEGRYMEAELGIGFRVFAERYISRVWLYPNRAVMAEAKNTTVFRVLRNEWQFEEGEQPGTTNVKMSVAFAFRSGLYAQVTDMFFDEVVHQMSSAFQKQALKLRPEQPLPPPPPQNTTSSFPSTAEEAEQEWRPTRAPSNKPQKGSGLWKAATPHLTNASNPPDPVDDEWRGPHPSSPSKRKPRQRTRSLLRERSALW